jgi:hypothetical protein
MSDRMTLQEVQRLAAAARDMTGHGDVIGNVRRMMVHHLNVTEDVPEDVVRIVATITVFMPKSPTMTDAAYGSGLMGVALGAWIAQVLRGGAPVLIQP